MALTAQELADRMVEIAEEHPEAEVRIDPPYSNVLGVYYRGEENTVELTH